MLNLVLLHPIKSLLLLCVKGSILLHIISYSMTRHVATTELYFTCTPEREKKIFLCKCRKQMVYFLLLFKKKAGTRFLEMQYIWVYVLTLWLSFLWSLKGFRLVQSVRALPPPPPTHPTPLLVSTQYVVSRTQTRSQQEMDYFHVAVM